MSNLSKRKLNRFKINSRGKIRNQAETERDIQELGEILKTWVILKRAVKISQEGRENL